MYIMALVIVLLIILLMFISIIINYKNRIHVEKLYTEKEIEYQNYKKQYKKITDNNKKLKFLRHDLVKHMSVTDELAKSNEKSGRETDVCDETAVCDETVVCDVKDVVDKNVICDEKNVYDMKVRRGQADCSDILKIINIIVSQKRDMAEKNGIIFKEDIENFIVDISEPDIVSLISNLLDNAIEACTKVKNEKNSCIIIRIHEKYISVINDMPCSEIYNKNDFKTTKKDKNLHGYGMKIINEIITRYNGDINILHRNWIFLSFRRV